MGVSECVEGIHQVEAADIPHEDVPALGQSVNRRQKDLSGVVLVWEVLQDRVDHHDVKVLGGELIQLVRATTERASLTPLERISQC